MVGQGDAERGNVPRVGWMKGSLVGANPENVSDEDSDILLSGRAERQSGSRRTGASFSFPLSLATYRSVFVLFDHFSHFHAPRGEAEEQSSMAGREPAYYAAKR